MLPRFMPEIRYYISGDRSPFADWFAELELVARAKVTTAIARIEQGNLSNVKSVGGGVLEYRIDFGPGYRVYFTKHGHELLILLAGGDKSTQSADIKTALRLARNL